MSWLPPEENGASAIKVKIYPAAQGSSGRYKRIVLLQSAVDRVAQQAEAVLRMAAEGAVNTD